MVNGGNRLFLFPYWWSCAALFLAFDSNSSTTVIRFSSGCLGNESSSGPLSLSSFHQSGKPCHRLKCLILPVAFIYANSKLPTNTHTHTSFGPVTHMPNLILLSVHTVRTVAMEVAQVGGPWLIRLWHARTQPAKPLHWPHLQSHYTS